MSDTRIGFGVAGLGIGRSRAKMVAACEDARLVAVSDVRHDRLRAFAEEMDCDAHTDYLEMAERDDIDCVLVMTPSGMHAQMAAEVMRRGKHVATTKPADVRLDTIDAAIAVAEQAGLTYAVDFGRRYEDEPRRIVRAMRDGRFGRPLLATIEMKWHRPEEYYANWRGTWELDGGGSMANQGIHQVDLMQWVMDGVKRVCGHYAVVGHQNCHTEDLAMAMLEFTSGARGSIVTTTTYSGSAQITRVGFHGTRGAALIENEQLCDWTVGEDADPLPAGPANIVEDMVGCIRGEREPACPASEGRKSVAILRAAYLSAERGGWVDLPLHEEPVAVR
ncbi:MAG: Gfo/Idh/MocA family protein [Armatimonadota bacterium]|jgi:UDP-N-acetyl-2-amino-2-deoxyglucuronate dehydrogenase